MRGRAKCFDELRAYLETVPLIDCHDHAGECGPKDTDPLLFIANSYFQSDLVSVSSDADLVIMQDTARPVEERWPVFERAWKRCCHTGYAQVFRRLLQHFYGIDTVTLESLQQVVANALDLADPAVYERILAEAGIAVRIANLWPDLRQVLDGTLEIPPRSRLVIPLPGFHDIRSASAVQQLAALLNRTVTTLDEYLEVCREIFQGFKCFGAIAFKDQSAYSRTLHFGNPARAEAESLFNWMMEDPRRSLGYPEASKPLDDYLFHAFLRMARDLEMPIQIHTGHMAGYRNEITKTNAIHLTSVIELHRDVRFDLFHANWPYSGELLYLAKNYSNVAIDFCWANIIDPIYCQEMFKQAISCVGHGKIHGYGTDMGGQVDRAWAHAAIARDNIAIALADLVEMEYLGLDDAKEIGCAWLFGNANEFFGLNLAPEKAAL